MPDDHWRDRSAGMRCGTCIWFVPKGTLGRCRRHAPTMSGFPVVYATDWCGDHKLDETKLPPPVWDDLPDTALPLHDPTDCRFCQAQETHVPFAPEA